MSVFVFPRRAAPKRNWIERRAESVKKTAEKNTFQKAVARMLSGILSDFAVCVLVF